MLPRFPNSAAPAASQGAVWIYALALIIDSAMPAPLGRLGATPGLAYLAWEPLAAADAGGAPTTTLIPAGGALAVPISPPAPPPGSSSYAAGDYFVLAPVLPSGWALLGEQLKLVPASSRRFASVLGPAGSGGLSATLRAASGEAVAVWVQPPTGAPLGVSCPSGACAGEDCDVALVLACAGAACNCTTLAAS